MASNTEANGLQNVGASVWPKLDWLATLKVVKVLEITAQDLDQGMDAFVDVA